MVVVIETEVSSVDLPSRKRRLRREVLTFARDACTMNRYVHHHVTAMTSASAAMRHTRVAVVP